MRQGSMRFSLGALLLTSLLTGYSYAQRARSLESFLIETAKPYDKVAAAVQAQGGRVTHEYAYVNAVAAEMPSDAVGVIRAINGVTAVYKDEEVAGPTSAPSTRSINETTLTTETSEPKEKVTSKDLVKLASISSGAYRINNAGLHLEELHALGFTGQGTTVAVIDTGFRSGFKLVQDAVIGGIDFVDDGAAGPAGDGQADWKQASNVGHGTFVAGLIAGNGTFTVNRAMKEALQLYAPGALVNDNSLSLVGTAPDARIYVVRVFGEAGAKVSTILAAVQHVIDQRQLFTSSGGRQGLKIDVANLSLGISTLAAGRTLLDQSIDQMMAAGIVPVVSAGDSGPSSLTVQSPGTARSALTVGAATRAVNERILYEVQYATQFARQYYPGIGADIRPFSGTEVDFLSSRGPSSDGRLDPEVVANGSGAIGQGYCPDQILEACFKRLTIGSGTSFSAPLVSGIAAVLIQAFPNATATQIRNAIVASGDVSAVEPYFDVLDRGHGIPNAAAAYALLQGGGVPDVLPALPPVDTLVRDNVESSTGLSVKSGSYGQSFANMKPGQRAEILYDVPLLADFVRIRVNNVNMHGPQNKFFNGDRLFLYVHSAKTSAAGFGDYKVNAAVLLDNGSGEFIVPNPDTGVMRVTLNPDTLNAGLVDADVSVDTALKVFGAPTRVITDSVKTGVIKLYTEPISAGTAELNLFLHWQHDWAHYPTSDVDVIACAPSIPGTIADCQALGNKTGATLASPERVVIPSPAPGTWTFLVNGFNVPLDNTEQFTLEIRH